MGRTAALFAYKIRFFFGPALRGRFGPLALLALIGLFVPSGYIAGTAIGMSLGTVIDPAGALDLLSTPLAALLSIALLYSLGAGVTAHASEFDFFLTGDIRPRQYLVADLVFQIVSLIAAGGLAAGVAAVAMVQAVGRPLVTAVPLVSVLTIYGFFVLMTSQVLVILRVRYPKAPVRPLTLVLLALSILPSISLAQPAFPLRFEDLPIPSTAFGGLGLSLIRGTPLAAADLGIAVLWAGGIGAAWFALSDTYIVHGLRPTMNAGFGQVDLGARMEMQRRLIGGLGGMTTRLRLRTERGGDTGLMTRFHLIRIWRDGSILFVLLFAFIAILPVGVGGAGGAEFGVTQTLTFLLGILAMNWAFYERDNLWIVQTAAKGPGAYFRGLLLAFATIGLGTTAAFLGILAATRSLDLPIASLALPIASPIAAAFVATAILTRIRLRPSAFSFAALGVFFLVSIGGFVGGLAARGIVLASEAFVGLAVGAQASVLVAFLFGLTAFSLWAVTRLAASFRL